MTIYGWDIHQWAKALAMYPKSTPTNVHEVIDVKCWWEINYKYEPNSKDIIIGVESKRDYIGAGKVLMIVERLKAESNLPC